MPLETALARTSSARLRDLCRDQSQPASLTLSGGPCRDGAEALASLPTMCQFLRQPGRAQHGAQVAGFGLALAEDLEGPLRRDARGPGSGVNSIAHKVVGDAHRRAVGQALPKLHVRAPRSARWTCRPMRIPAHKPAPDEPFA